MASFRFTLIHPFTPSVCGVPEKQVSSLYTSLFMVLADIHKEGQWACDVTFLTDEHNYYEKKDDYELPWKFYPLSLRHTSASHEFGRQWSWALWRQMLFDPPTAVCLFIGNGAFAKMIAATCLLRRVPYFVIVAGWGVPRGRSQNFYFDKAWRVIVHTRKHLEVLAELGFSRRNMAIMPIGVDTRRFGTKPVECNEERYRAPVVLFVGRVIPSKGVLEAIEAFASIRQRFPNAILRIVGPALDPNYFSIVNKRITELALHDAVEMTGESVPNNLLPQIYREADIFLFPTQSESLGIVMLESMACGTPVVTLKGSGSTDEVVRNGTDGLVVEPEELASAAISLLEDRDTLHQMGRSASERVQAEYSYEVTSSILRQLLDGAIRRPSGYAQ
jgi:glycosyltransferase involved in cell wall biosynthesis